MIRTTCRRRPLQVEALEERSLLTVVPGGLELQVNSYTTVAQFAPAVASDHAGNRVVVWTSDTQDGDGQGVFAQRFDAAGAPLGGEFQVNAHTTGDQSDPAVAMEPDGDFVVVWKSDGEDGDGDGVFAQRFDENGVPQGGPLQVNATAAGHQQQPAVATSANGGFTVAWQSLGQDGDGSGIYAQRFSSTGAPIGFEFQANTETASHQSQPALAMDVDGDFLVLWQSFGQDGNGDGVFGQRFDVSGIAMGPEFQVNTYTTGGQSQPVVAMDAGGDYVVAWHSSGQDGSGYGIYAQRYDAAGAPLGGEFQVNDHTPLNQRSPSVAVDVDGDFVVAWQSAAQDGSDYGIYARRYGSNGSPQSGEFRVNSFTAGDQLAAGVAMDAGGGFLVAWQSTGQDGSGEGIFAQRYGETEPSTVLGVATQSGEPIAVDDTLTERVTALVVSFSRNMSTLGGDNGADSVTNPANYELLRSGMEMPAAIADIDYGYNPLSEQFEATLHLSGPLSSGAYQWTLRDALRTAHGVPLDGDSNGIPGGDYVHALRMSQLVPGSEFQVNTYTTGSQYSAAVAVAPSGDFVVAWQSNDQDGISASIRGQRYDASGVPQGDEFRVSDGPGNSSASRPSIGMDDQGNFVVVWQENSSERIAARRFGPSGVALGESFQVNSYTSGNFTLASVDMDADGNFVVAWTSTEQDGDDNGVYAQRYDADGVPQGGEFRVNTTTANREWNPSVAIGADGDFVIAWHSETQFGSSLGIYAQRYDAGGVPQGGEFQVNSYTGDVLRWSSAAMGPDGDFLITWGSDNQDGSDGGVFAQRFDASGTPQGGEFQVNSFTAGSQLFGKAAADDEGNYLITWQSDNQDGDKYGVFARRYAASGTPIGDEFQVNVHSDNGQDQPRVATAGDQVVMAWSSDGQDGDQFGVFARQYTIFAPGVTGRHLFYNQSKFDGNTVGADSSDDLAVATDKSAYLPGSGAATFDHISSYSRGINGVMVDIANPGGTITADDFTFRVSTQVQANNTPSSWASAPAPSDIALRAGAGVDGSDRVTIVWEAGAISNQWLQVIVEGNDAIGGFNTNTGLNVSDVFYFGNRIGDTGSGTPTLAVTSAADEIATRNNPGFGATITNVYDFDRSGLVNAVDSLIARNNAGLLTKINVADPPAAPAITAESSAAVANALAIPAAVTPSAHRVPATAPESVAPGGRGESATARRAVRVSAALPASATRQLPATSSETDTEVDEKLLDLLAAALLERM
ncbi:MAG: hypothetical protein DWQ37_19500 [Planctomycetota bacterium]|nr:MAG: hypothetical protein DWQ37_19500 [Planctomycetota bacterium]